ncbi:hypothetical protein P8452_77954 [Trifolium repens]|nr:hypothetical protein P8452_77954 [Trifolium repens]
MVSSPILLITIFSIWLLISCSESKEYIVGVRDGKKSWRFPLPSFHAFTNWSSTHQFTIGDTIVFEYDKMKESVHEVNEHGYIKSTLFHKWKKGSLQNGIKGAENNNQAPPRPHSTEVLHQRKKAPFCPMRMAIGGFAAISVLGYFVLYANKKPEASALDVAKVSSGVAHPDNTHPLTGTSTSIHYFFSMSQQAVLL